MDKTPSTTGGGLLPPVIFPIASLVTLFIAYLLDRWLFTQTRLARSGISQPTINPLFVWTIVSGLVLFAAWLVVSWITLARTRRSVPVSILGMIVGLLLFIYPYLQMYAVWLPMLFFATNTPLAYTGLYISVLSGLQLIIRNPTISLDATHRG